jgi:hypothetical protein
VGLDLTSTQAEPGPSPCQETALEMPSLPPGQVAEDESTDLSIVFDDANVEQELGGHRTLLYLGEFSKSRGKLYINDRRRSASDKWYDIRSY